MSKTATTRNYGILPGSWDFPYLALGPKPHGILVSMDSPCSSPLDPPLLNHAYPLTEEYGCRWEFPKISGTLLGVSIKRIIVYWGLYWVFRELAKQTKSRTSANVIVADFLDASSASSSKHACAETQYFRSLLLLLQQQPQEA